MFVYPYKKGSKSAKALAAALNCKSLTRPKRSRKGPVINWGKSFPVNVNVATKTMLNKPFAVALASNKLDSFKMFVQNGIACPDFTTDVTIADRWLAEGETVVCRTLLRSHSGKGIVIANRISELVNAPLYVKYFKKTYEYRVHVFNGKVIDFVQKLKRSGVDANNYVRSYNNGWVFCRNNIVLKDEMKTFAINAVNALGLNFGAVDIVMKKNGKMNVLEVNSAPALSGTTLVSYTNAIKEYVDVQGRG